MAKTPPGSGSLGSRLRGSSHCKRQDGGNDTKLRKQAQSQHGCVRAQRTGQNERERERGALYRVLLLVRWRRRERQVVSGLRRKNTGHAHTRTHTGARPCPAGHREGPPQAVAPDGVHPSIWKTSVPTPALGRLPALPNSTEEAKFSSRRTARKLSTTEGKFATNGHCQELAKKPFSSGFLGLEDFRMSFFYFFPPQPLCAACGILVPQSGTEPATL